MSRKTIKDSLIKQLDDLGGKLDHYEDLIGDYMALWDTKRKLIKDVKERGVVYEDVSSVGVKMMKNNSSVKDLVMVNRQMLSILKELGLTTDSASSGDEDDL